MYLNNDELPFLLLVDEDGMDYLDNERRPHFPQFSYSASGREWTIHRSDIITAGLWGHQCGTKRPTALDWPTDPHWLEGFCPSPLLFLLFFHLSRPLLFFFYFCECLFRRNLQTKRWPELRCDQLLCNVPLMSGASLVACCALMCVCPAKPTEQTPPIQLNDSWCIFATSYLCEGDTVF